MMSQNDPVFHDPRKVQGIDPCAVQQNYSEATCEAVALYLRRKDDTLTAEEVNKYSFYVDGELFEAGTVKWCEKLRSEVIVWMPGKGILKEHTIGKGTDGNFSNVYKDKKPILSNDWFLQFCESHEDLRQDLCTGLRTKNYRDLAQALKTKHGYIAISGTGMKLMRSDTKLENGKVIELDVATKHYATGSEPHIIWSLEELIEAFEARQEAPNDVAHTVRRGQNTIPAEEDADEFVNDEEINEEIDDELADRRDEDHFGDGDNNEVGFYNDGDDDADFEQFMQVMKIQNENSEKEMASYADVALAFKDSFDKQTKAREEKHKMQFEFFRDMKLSSRGGQGAAARRATGGQRSIAQGVAGNPPPTATVRRITQGPAGSGPSMTPRRSIAQVPTGRRPSTATSRRITQGAGSGPSATPRRSIAQGRVPLTTPRRGIKGAASGRPSVTPHHLALDGLAGGNTPSTELDTAKAAATIAPTLKTPSRPISSARAATTGGRKRRTKKTN